MDQFVDDNKMIDQTKLKEQYKTFTGINSEVSDTELQRFSEQNPNICEQQMLCD